MNECYNTYLTKISLSRQNKIIVASLYGVIITVVGSLTKNFAFEFNSLSPRNDSLYYIKLSVIYVQSYLKWFRLPDLKKRNN